MDLFGMVSGPGNALEAHVTTAMEKNQSKPLEDQTTPSPDPADPPGVRSLEDLSPDDRLQVAAALLQC